MRAANWTAHSGSTDLWLAPRRQDEAPARSTRGKPCSQLGWSSIVKRQCPITTRCSRPLEPGEPRDPQIGSDDLVCGLELPVNRNGRCVGIDDLDDFLLQRKI